MEERHPKIVILKEEASRQPGVSGEVLKAAKISRESPAAALDLMATEFEPTPDSVMETPEGGFFTGEFTDTDVEALKKNKQVEDVVDDEIQYAYGPRLEGSDLLIRESEELAEDFDEAILEHDEAELRALEEELNQDLAAPTEEPTAEEMNLVVSYESALTEEDIEIEHALLDLAEGAPDILPEALRDPALTLPAVRGLFRTLKEQGRALDEVSDEDMKVLLRARGLLAPEILAADVILPNIRMIYANLAWRFSMGAGARVAIVDTGISPHPDLAIRGGVSYVPGVGSWRDDHGHGTHVAGITAALLNGRGIVGVAPRARVYAVKVLDRTGRGRLSSILNGLMWCYARHMHVVNLSLGSPFSSHDPRQYNTAYERVGRILRSRGILLVAAAGNDRMRPVGNPARCPSYMAVSAIDFRRRFAPFSNIGPQVEICAPGVQILSTVPAGYRRMSGTSMAAPHVTGAGALVKGRYPTLHGDVVRRRLIQTALDLGRPGRDWFFGAGQVNAYRAVAG